MDNNIFGLKEIYDCIFSSTYDIEIGNRIIKAGEPILRFDSLQLANFDEIKSRVNATGGYNNQTWVSWESTKEVNFDFSQGIFSKVQLAILGNAALESVEDVAVPKVESLELDESRQVRLKYAPSELFIYKKESGEPLTAFEQDEFTLTFPELEPYTEIEVYYNFIYSKADVITIGRRLVTGYLTMTAKTRLKDDKTGKTVTGVFRAPKIKLMSDFSIRLGNDASPAVGSFAITAYPTGSKGSEKVVDFILLNDDIDSDF